MTANQFQEAVKHIRCWGPEKFEEIFGGRIAPVCDRPRTVGERREDGDTGLAEHLWTKLQARYKGDIGAWIAALDMACMRAVMTHVRRHLRQYGVR